MDPVVVVRCPSYEPAVLDAALERLLAPLGGPARFFAAGAEVLLKPNALRPAPPERAVTTHPAFVAAVGRLVRRAGGRPALADSPGAALPHGPAAVRRVLRGCGLDACGVPLVADAGLEPVQAAVRAGRLVRRVSLLRAVAEARCLVNLPKVKTHCLTVFSGAVKNLFGALPGLEKPAFHARLPRPADFGRMLFEIARHLSPVLSLADGVVAMEGDGPNAGTPRQAGFLAAATDCFALDLALCDLCGLDPWQVEYLRLARDEGLVPGSAAALPRAGDWPAEERLAPPLKPPRTAARRGAFGRALNNLAFGALRRWLTVRPIVDRRRCTGCGACWKACPVQAAAPAGGRAKVREERCLRCYCCHELCPAQAIVLYRPALHRWLMG